MNWDQSKAGAESQASYQNVGDGEWFVFVDEELCPENIRLRTSNGHTLSNGRAYESNGFESLHVRRVTFDCSNLRYTEQS